jgi:predicted nucleotidyltransferase
MKSEPYHVSKVFMTQIDDSIPIKPLMDYCKEHPSISKLSLFGSALSGSLRKNSDIDLLIEFEPDQTPSLFTIVTMEDELASLLGRKADLRTAQDLSVYFRDEVLSSARLLYVKS